MNLDTHSSPPLKAKRSFWRVLGLGLGGLAAILILVLGVVAALVQWGAPPTFPVTMDSFATYKVELTPERVKRGRALAEMRGCFDCHVNPETRSATGIAIPDVPKAIAAHTHGANITKDPNLGIGSYTDGQLAYLLRTGVRPDGSLLLPWMPRMVQASDDDLAAMVAFLRSNDSVVAANPVPSKGTQLTFLGRALRRFVWKPDALLPGPIVAPLLSEDKVAYGRYVVAGMADCYACHSANFALVNNAQPELTPGFLGGGNPMMDLEGNPVFSANLTPDPETGIGKWSEREFVTALRSSVKPNGGPMRYPMPRYHHLSEEEAAAVFAYLQTVPPIRNAVMQ
jgi:mono/diheme cytochrome c family protein